MSDSAELKPHTKRVRVIVKTESGVILLIDKYRLVPVDTLVPPGGFVEIEKGCGTHS